MPLLERQLRDTSLRDMEQHQQVYVVALHLLRALTMWPHLQPLLAPLRGQDDCLDALLATMRSQAEMCVKGAVKGGGGWRGSPDFREALDRSRRRRQSTLGRHSSPPAFPSLSYMKGLRTSLRSDHELTSAKKVADAPYKAGHKFTSTEFAALILCVADRSRRCVEALESRPASALDPATSTQSGSDAGASAIATASSGGSTASGGRGGEKGRGEGVRSDGKTADERYAVSLGDLQVRGHFAHPFTLVGRIRPPADRSTARSTTKWRPYKAITTPMRPPRLPARTGVVCSDSPRNMQIWPGSAPCRCLRRVQSSYGCTRSALTSSKH